MNDLKKDFKIYKWMSREIKNTNALILYAYIYERKRMAYDVERLARYFNISEATLKKHIRFLINNNYIRIEKDKNMELILRNKNLHGLGYGTKKCEWCGIRTNLIHLHHYPIQKCDGGKKVVKICANCHGEYHNPMQYLCVNERKG